MPIDHCSTLDRIVDYVPDILGKVCECMKNKNEDEEEEKNVEDNKKEDEVENKAEKIVIKSEIEDENEYLEDE